MTGLRGVGGVIVVVGIGIEFAEGDAGFVFWRFARGDVGGEVADMIIGFDRKRSVRWETRREAGRVLVFAYSLGGGMT